MLHPGPSEFNGYDSMGFNGTRFDSERTIVGNEGEILGLNHGVRTQYT